MPIPLDHSGAGKITLKAPSSGTTTYTLPSADGTNGQLLSTNGTGTLAWASAGGSFASGTVMLFVQTSAPTGWTKSTTHDDKALRIVSGTAGTGGSVAFTTAFAASLSAGATTLTTAQMPAHTHSVSAMSANGTGSGNQCNSGSTSNSSITTGSTGGGGSHTHTLPSFAVSYVDVIIATKD